MWNLSALADKAKEAAARIERQLDDSVGVESGSTSAEGGSVLGGLAGAISSSKTTNNNNNNVEASSTHDDLNDDDDFFSDDVVPTLSSTPQTSNVGSTSNDWQDNGSTHVVMPDAPSVTQFNASSDEQQSDDFFGGKRVPPQQQESEEIDFGTGDADVDMGDGDGWDDGADIPLDDEDENGNEISPVVPQQDTEVEHNEIGEVTHEMDESSNIPPPEQYEPGIVEDKQPTEEMYHAHQDFESSPPETQVNDTSGLSTETTNDIIEMESNSVVEESNPLLDQVTKPPESNEDEIVPDEANVVDTDTIKEDDVQPEDAVAITERLIQNGESSVGQADSIPSDPGSQTIPTAPSMDDAEKQQYLATIAQLESQLYQREEQLASKSDQITSLTLQFDSETTQLRTVISETKEEAKKRILRAKDRVEEMQTKLTDAVRRADAAGGSSQEQSGIIAALRAEGEQLARKQSTMEQSVRSAKGEARELQEKLDIEMDARKKEEAKVDVLEKEVKSLKDELASARKGETLSKKLEGELVAAKEESEKQRASNLVLDQQLKELKDERKALKKEVEEARAGAAIELEGESNKLRKERDDMLGDLENKLRTSEREANVREDALRHEVSELRKRWQDAVRRAEDLSMDVQHSTAPLLRQLESTERQSRARATAWAELETKLRSDIEENVIQLEKLTKERNDLAASDKRSQRLLKEKEEEIASSQETIDELSSTIDTLETKVEELEEEGKKIKQELVAAERKASEGASKVRNEMLQTVVDSEARYQSRIDTLEDELNGEKEQRSALEKQLDDLAASVSAAQFAEEHARNGRDQNSPSRQKKLRSATDQASILHDTLAGFDSEVDDDDEEDDERDENGNSQMMHRGSSSFAAMEQLAQGLKGAKVELEALRKQLASSEETRESLSRELGEARQAVEKLPLFEQKVSDLTMEVKMKEDEIRCLQEDIADVRFLYRTQLDSLLEEKAATPSPSIHSSVSNVSNVEEEKEEEPAKKPVIVDGWED